MILSIESSLNSFKTVTFREGLNVLLSDKGKASTEKQTRNSAGKTSLVEIIHFLCGADCDKESLFRAPELIEHTFKGRFRIDGREFTLERSGSEPSKIFLLVGGEGRSDIPTKVDKASERIYVSNTHWKNFLGRSLFGLPQEESGTAFDEAFTPTFRSMFSYFARRRDSGGFIGPERQAEKQHRSDWQVNLSYLLGLDWQIPFEFTKIRIREKTLEELRKAVKVGALGQVVGTVAELRPQVTIADAKAEKLRRELSMCTNVAIHRRDASGPRCRSASSPSSSPASFSPHAARPPPRPTRCRCPDDRGSARRGHAPAPAPSGSALRCGVGGDREGEVWRSRRAESNFSAIAPRAGRASATARRADSWDECSPASEGGSS